MTGRESPGLDERLDIISSRGGKVGVAGTVCIRYLPTVRYSYEYSYCRTVVSQSV